MVLSPSEQAQLGSQCRERFFALHTDIDAVVTDDPIHIGYLSGYRSILQDMPPYAQVLIATREKIALVTGASDGAAALEALGEPDAIWRYGRFFVFNSGDMPSYRDMPAAQPTVTDAFAAALASVAGLSASASIACDIGRADIRAILEKTLPQARLSSAADAFRRSRAVKLPGELDLLRHASGITDKAVEIAASMMQAGVTELELAAEITRTITLGGGIARFVVVTSGERASRVDAYATGRALVNGDLVRLDIGGTVHGYYSDMARTYAVGEPGSLARERYEALRRGEAVELQMVRAGVPAGDIFDAALREVRASGLPEYERNHCGHGIGLRSHEFPLIGPGNGTLLEPGMVLCVETPYYEIGWGGMMVEDTIIVTESGCELLTETSRDLCRSA